MASLVFDLPTYKILLSQLSTAKLVDNKQTNSKFYVWDVNFSGVVVQLSNVWLQGHIKSVTDSKQNHVPVASFYISDGTGEAEVVGVSKIPRPSTYKDFSVKDTVIVIGYVLQARENNSKIKAMKVIHIKNDSAVGLQIADWHKEVKETQNIIVKCLKL